MSAIEKGEAPLTLDAAAVRAADRAARIWEAGEPGPIVLGSEEHKQAFCRMLLDTHNPYRPSVVDWPVLECEARDRLVSLPIWDIAMQTEGNASLRVLSYAETIADPLLREAVEIDGFEETRHKQVLSNLVEAYGIRLAPEPEYQRPRHPEWAFLLAGFCECVDTFFAFGLFALAKRSGFFPPELVDTFEPVVQEEGRHRHRQVNRIGKGGMKSISGSCRGSSVLPSRCGFHSEDPQRRPGDQVTLKVEVVEHG
jgi:hypothetical protein